MKRLIFTLAFVASTLVAGSASAHMFWVNLTESLNHPPGHVTTILGFGHALPMDDLLSGTHGVIKIGKYDLVAPDNSRFDLGLPDPAVVPSQKTPTNMGVTTGDLGLRKIACKKDSVHGTYQVVAESKPAYFTSYINKKGKPSMAPTSMDKIKDLKSVIASVKYQSFAKSFFKVGKWTEPKPLGHDLELLPLTDLSNVHAGDLVRFKVTFKGRPVSADENAIRSMSCTSNTFGGPDNFFLGSYLMNGEAQFRIPTAGQWVANVYYKQDVDKDPQLKDLKGKSTVSYTAGSIGFSVKP